MKPQIIPMILYTRYNKLKKLRQAFNFKAFLQNIQFAALGANCIIHLEKFRFLSKVEIDSQ